MSDADEAYAYAEAKIEEAIAEGATELDLDPHANHQLTRNLLQIPRNISRLIDLEHLDLQNTQVEDLEPISGSYELLSLYLDNTKVKDLLPIRNLAQIQEISVSQSGVLDLQPLSNLAEIKSLNFMYTSVADLRPITGFLNLLGLTISKTKVISLKPIRTIPALRLLDCQNTRISDLSPLLDLHELRNESLRTHVGIWFKNTAATENNQELQGISEIEDTWDRTQELLDYLEAQEDKKQQSQPTLNQTTEDEASDAEPPRTTGERPAPLMVQTNADGALEPSPPPIDLTADAEERAQQAWDALKIYIGEIEDLTERIHNRMPRLGKSLDSLKRAMGDDFAAMNQIDLGMQGDRVVRLSVLAGDILLEEDAVEVQAFAAQTALYLRRFNTWETYKDDAPPDVETVQHVREDRQDFKDLRDGLETEALATEGVLAALDDLIEEGTEAESDPLAARGLLDSEVNVLDALAEQAIAAKTEGEDKAPGFIDDLHEQSTAKFRDKALDNIAVAGGVAALTYFFTHGGPINKLAARYPDRFAYLTTVLHWLFG